MKNLLIIKILIFFGGCLTVTAQNSAVLKANDRLSPSPKGTVSIQGYLGQKLELCIQNGIMQKDYELYIKPFAVRNDDPSKWQGEFWGKWFTSAALAYGYQPSQKHLNLIQTATEGLMNTQTPQGRLSSYTKDFGDWDIWGRKYALLGLVAYYDQTGDKRALDAAARGLDDLIAVAGPGKQKLTETGLSLLEALSSNSVLEPVVLIYQRTGQQKYLDFANYIVEQWSLPNKYTARGMRLVEDALAGVDPIHISAPKGYEQMSCFEGLCELYRVTGNQKYLDAVVTFGHKVRETENMIVGSGSSGELWCNGAMRQTELLEQPMETCVTATWIKFCYQLLRLTGDPVWADEMEVTLYNALLGAMADDGNWWAYFSPLMGERMPSPLQVPSCNTSCCVANGPRGLLTVPGWSVMRSNDGPVINLYAKGEWKYALPEGNELVLNQNTDYPKTGEIELLISQKKSARYTISLRIPAWSKNTKVWVNGDLVEANASGYLQLGREWKDGDKVKLSLDMRGRVLKAPGNPNQMAVMRGPVVLALDSRFVKEKSYNLWLLHDGYNWKHDQSWKIDYALLEPVSSFPQEMYIDLNPVNPLPDGVWMAFEVPFLYRPTHFVNHKKESLVMCDYASAGNQYSTENLFRVWMPQPLFLNYLYPKDSWRVLYQKDGDRPKFPHKH